MLKNNPKSWFSNIFRFHRSDTLRALLPEMLFMAIYTGVLTYLLWTYSTRVSFFKNAISVHALIGFVMGLFLVFRTNTAYDRWWEGRKQWGALVNTSRNLAIKLKALIPESHQSYTEEMRELLAAYPYAVKLHLRGYRNFQINDLSEKLRAEIEHKRHIPNAIAAALYKRLSICHREKAISGEELIILDNQVSQLTDIIGACERIKSSPIPFSYIVFMKRFIFIYCITLPIGLIPDFEYWSVPITVFIFYVMVSLEMLAEEIEDPFGTDNNDLPLAELAWKIKSDVKELSNEKETADSSPNL